MAPSLAVTVELVELVEQVIQMMLLIIYLEDHLVLLERKVVMQQIWQQKQMNQVQEDLKEILVQAHSPLPT
jgi:hypothetical protein